MADIRQCTQSLSKSGVEQTALFRAWGAKNNLEMDKFRDEVQKELAEESTKAKKGGDKF